MALRRQTYKEPQIETILNLYKRGKSMRQIASIFDLSYRTVHYHLKNRGAAVRRRGRGKKGTDDPVE